MRLTPAMRDALRRARHEPLRRVHRPGPGHPAWPASAPALAALARRELVKRSADISRRGYRMDVWTITDRGRAALEPRRVIRRLRPLYLAEGWPDLTTDAGRKMRGEPEVFREVA